MMRWMEFEYEEDSVNSHFPFFLRPDQFLSDRCLSRPAADEMALKWEVFADGLRQFWTLAGNPNCWHTPEFDEEEKWILSEEREWPFAFVSLCETFGFEVESLRATLLAQKNERGTEAVYA